MGVKPPQQPYIVATKVVRSKHAVEVAVRNSAEPAVEKIIEKIVEVDSPALLEKYNAALVEIAELKKHVCQTQTITVEVPVERIIEKTIEVVRAGLWPAYAGGLFLFGLLIGWRFI